MMKSLTLLFFSALTLSTAAPVYGMHQEPDQTVPEMTAAKRHLKLIEKAMPPLYERIQTLYCDFLHDLKCIAEIAPSIMAKISLDDQKSFLDDLGVLLVDSGSFINILGLVDGKPVAQQLKAIRSSARFMVPEINSVQVVDLFLTLPVEDHDQFIEETKSKSGPDKLSELKKRVSRQYR